MNISPPGTDLRPFTLLQKFAASVNAMNRHDRERAKRNRVAREDAEIKRDLDYGRDQ